MSIDWLALARSVNWPEVGVSLALASSITYVIQRWCQKRPQKSKVTLTVSTTAGTETDITSKSMQFQVGAKGDLQNVSVNIQELAGVESQLPAGEPADNGLKHELERLNNKLDQVDLRLAVIVRNGIQTTLAILGATIVLTGFGNLIQNGKVVLESWSSPNNFIIFIGFLVVILASLMYKPSFKKGLQIAIWVLQGMMVCLVIAIIVLLLLK
jgi:hypothetical protein